MIAEQIIRPTGLLDPTMEVRPIKGQVEDVIGEIQQAAEAGERTLVTTLTKRMSEDLASFLREAGVRVEYLHSDIDAIERVEILRNLRQGRFDVLVGVNLLREGLDLPEVALVGILDADKEGFLRVLLASSRPQDELPDISRDALYFTLTTLQTPSDRPSISQKFAEKSRWLTMKNTASLPEV